MGIYHRRNKKSPKQSKNLQHRHYNRRTSQKLL